MIPPKKALACHYTFFLPLEIQPRSIQNYRFRDEVFLPVPAAIHGQTAIVFLALIAQVTSTIYVAYLTFSLVRVFFLDQHKTSFSIDNCCRFTAVEQSQLTASGWTSSPACKHGRRTSASDVAHTIYLRFPGNCLVSFCYVITRSKSSCADLADAAVMLSLSSILSRDNCRYAGTHRQPSEASTFSIVHTATDH